MMPEHPWALLRFVDEHNNIGEERKVENVMNSAWIHVDIGWIVEIDWNEEIFCKKTNVNISCKVVGIKNYLYTRGYMEYTLRYINDSLSFL